MSFGIAHLIEVMQRLRAPETGCPWDLQQDHKSLARYTLEEAYEERGTDKALKRRQDTISHMAQYDAETVYETMWKPYLDEMANDMKKPAPKSAPNPMGNRAERRSKR